MGQESLFFRFRQHLLRFGKHLTKTRLVFFKTGSIDVGQVVGHRIHLALHSAGGLDQTIDSTHESAPNQTIAVR